jgi:hypothetical protein
MSTVSSSCELNCDALRNRSIANQSQSNPFKAIATPALAGRECGNATPCNTARPMLGDETNPTRRVRISIDNPTPSDVQLDYRERLTPVDSRHT